MSGGVFVLEYAPLHYWFPLAIAYALALHIGVHKAIAHLTGKG